MALNPRVVILGQESRDRIVAGVNILADAVRVTLGPKGRNVVIQREHGAPHITKDGVTVAREIVLEDKLADSGVRLIKQVANQTADDIGDGTTTATVLTQAMVREGMKYVTAGMSPINLKRGIDLAVQTVVDELATMSKECEDPTTIAQVATISANNDGEMGQLIADALTKVGKMGTVTVESGNGLKDELDSVSGLSYEQGMLSPYFVNADKGRCILENPYIVLADRPILNVNDLVPALEKLAATGRPFLIMAEQVENDALATLVVNTHRGNIKTCAVRGPDWKGPRRTILMEDIAILTGGKVLSEVTGKQVKNLELSDLGQCNRVEITRTSTLIIGGHGSKDDVDARVASIKQELEEEPHGDSNFNREGQLERISKLSGGISVIRVGAATNTEMMEKKDRIDDSLHATRAAMEEGIVPGGGVAYIRIKEKLKDLKGNNDEQNAGIQIVLRALEEPLRQIAENAGDSPDVIVNKVKESDTEVGYDASDSTFGNMFETGIIDPTKVVKAALINAASVAGLLLTTDCAIYEVPLERKAGGAPDPSPPAGHPLPEKYNV
jgi:chaperonin GroEL